MEWTTTSQHAVRRRRAGRSRAVAARGDGAQRRASLAGDLAIAFFIVYWVLSGPVSFLILSSKKKKGMSWQIFAASALAATLLTVGVVKLVLGASADIHHITFVRMSPGSRRW